MRPFPAALHEENLRHGSIHPRFAGRDEGQIGNFGQEQAGVTLVQNTRGDTIACLPAAA
jgi:hypothetical protein